MPALKTRLLLTIASVFLLIMPLWAVEPLVFDSAEQEARFKTLTEELRCLVCQNQNLADSDAPLAQDLRQEVLDLLKTGRTDDQIKQFLVDRYSDFVLYRPPVRTNTLLLWFLPGLLIFSGLIALVFIIRRRHRLFLAEQESDQS